MPILNPEEVAEAGRWEAAVGAIESLDVRRLVHALADAPAGENRP